MATDTRLPMIAALKRSMRREIASALETLSDVDVMAQSRALADKVSCLPDFARARGISVYLAMPKEAATTELLQTAFASNKKVYVPKIMGPSADDLTMLQVQSMDEIQRFPKVASPLWTYLPVSRSRFHPSVLTDTGIPRQDAMQCDEIDLVLLPGVAFDRRGGRLGHGKGFYDSFLRRLMEHYDAIGHPPPVTIGLCLAPQLVEQVPLAAHDRMLDIIVTPHEVINTRSL
ncbi:hypothetical protein PsorP6_006728 [Peronosclerospora sorghi]|uniref:Uncharacterized protein n=1 Tax=Peronosclerospora sorghi TaxID=230839 RepID=A0ACC0W1J5_9STRA|nr:hypothetical protein PsorP6_006728 [Peronosclerospora sorghi]